MHQTQTKVSDLEKQVVSISATQQAAEENMKKQLSKVADMARKLEEATINIPQVGQRHTERQCDQS